MNLEAETAFWLGLLTGMGLVLLFHAGNQPAEPELLPPSYARVIQVPCLATAVGGGVCSIAVGDPGHVHPPPADRLYKAGCMEVNDQEVGCKPR